MSLRGAYRVLRLPLVATAAADVVAGYTVALLPAKLGNFSWETALVLAGTSSGLYLFGMVENDLVDVRRDRIEGNPRPLVTGELGIPAAVGLLVAALALAVFSASHLRGGALMTAILTFLAINLYNLGAKHGPSPVAMGTMGMCRLLNFGIGATAAVGFPQEVSLGMILPSGPLWVRHGLALFFATWVITGYSICVRRGYTVSTRPWWLVVAAAVLMLVLSVLMPRASSVDSISIMPTARAFSLLVLAMLWPGRLWSPMGPERKAQEYGRFVERAIYWMIVMDIAFVMDGLTMITRQT